MTEAQVIQVLRRHYLWDRGRERGNGDEWGFMPQVRNKAGMDAKRTCDLIVFGLWPSRGLPVIGHEIKCSRSDWLTELRKPAKAEAFHEHVDGWYVVTAYEDIVRTGELPDGWGHMLVTTVRGVEKIKVVTPATLKAKEDRPAELSRSFVAAMLKVACRTMDATPDEVSAANKDGYDQGKASVASNVERLTLEVDQLRSREREFMEASGVSFGRWHGQHDPAELGKALRLLLDGNRDADDMEKRLRRLRDNALDIAQLIDTRLDPAKPEDITF